jgi:hypothetical protein
LKLKLAVIYRIYFGLTRILEKESGSEAGIDGLVFTDDIFLEASPITEIAFLSYFPCFEKKK